LKSASGMDALDLALDENLPDMVAILEAHIKQKEIESSDEREDSLSHSMGLSR